MALAYAIGGEDEEAKNEPAAAIINVSSSFDLKTLFQTAGQKLVVLDFTAVRNAQHDNNACIDRPRHTATHSRLPQEWCPPSRAMNPVFADLCNSNKDVVFARVDIEAARELANIHGINSIPTFKFYKGGRDLGHTINGAHVAQLKSTVAKLK